MLYWILGRPLLWAERKWKSAASKLFPGASVTLPTWFWRPISAGKAVLVIALGALIASGLITNRLGMAIHTLVLFMVLLVIGILVWTLLDDFRCVLWPERHVCYWFYTTRTAPLYYEGLDVRCSEGVEPPPDLTWEKQVIMCIPKHRLWGSQWVCGNRFKLTPVVNYLGEVFLISITDHEGNTLQEVPLVYLRGLDDDRRINLTITAVADTHTCYSLRQANKLRCKQERRAEFWAKEWTALLDYFQTGRTNATDLAVVKWMREVQGRVGDIPMLTFLSTDQLPRLNRKKTADPPEAGSTSTPTP